MLPAILSIPAKMATLLARITSTRATNLDNLDATVSTRSTLTSAQAATAVWGAATRTLTSVTVTSMPSVIDSIQEVSGNMTTLTLDVTITAVTVAKSVIVFAGASGPAGGAMDYFPRATLINSTTVRITRQGTGVGTTQYAFYVVEFN